jgi:SEC-C motif domain protein
MKTEPPRVSKRLARAQWAPDAWAASSIFTSGNIDYLIATHHPTKRQGADRQTLTQTMAETQWLSLRILNSERSKEATGVGTVEFVAFYKSQGKIGQLHERSDFVRQNDRWYYLHGNILEPISIGRNDLCWCGSGTKYKKCHGT